MIKYQNLDCLSSLVEIKEHFLLQVSKNLSVLFEGERDSSREELIFTTGCQELISPMQVLGESKTL
jgi:hypothetical protein